MFVRSPSFVLAEAMVVTVNKANQEQKLPDGFRLSVVAHSGETVQLQISARPSKHEKFVQAHVELRQEKETVLRVPITAKANSSGSRSLELLVRRDQAKNTFLGLFFDPNSPDLPSTGTLYLIELGSYIEADKPVQEHTAERETKPASRDDFKKELTPRLDNPKKDSDPKQPDEDGEKAPKKLTPMSFAGTWETTWGPLTIELVPSKDRSKIAFKGSWEQGPGKTGAIKRGTFDPKTGRVEFSFFEPWNESTGTTHMQLAKDGRSFIGTWSFTGSTSTGTWNMRRDNQEP